MRFRQLFLLVVVLAPGLARADEISSLPPWTGSIDGEFRFYSWSNVYAPARFGGPSKGSQIYTPVFAQAQGALNAFWNLEIQARSGWVTTKQKGSFFSGSFSTPLDSDLSATLSYRGPSAFQPFLSLDANLPTGQSVLKGTAVYAHADPDLAGTATFGEGFNLGPTVGANFALSPSLLLTGALGYTHRGAYNSNGADFFSLSDVSRVDPGDDLTPTVTLAYRAPRVLVQATASEVFEDYSRIDGFKTYREGPKTLLSGFAQYEFTDRWDARASASWTHAEPTKVVAFSPIEQTPNLDEDVVQAQIDPRYHTGPWAFGPTARFLWRSHDSWDPSDGLIIPAKTLGAVGAAAEFAASSAFSLQGRLEGFRVREMPEARLFEPALSGYGWNATLSASYKF